jgi:hypothetical protein
LSACSSAGSLPIPVRTYLIFPMINTNTQLGIAVMHGFQTASNPFPATSANT